MGARIFYSIKTELDKPHIVLYSHWGETSWREDLALALDFAKPRLKLGDLPYATRNIIDQLTKSGRDEQTGFGIFLADESDDLGEFTVEIDMTTQMVNDTGNWHSFESFVEYQQEVSEYHDA